MQKKKNKDKKVSREIFFPTHIYFSAETNITFSKYLRLHYILKQEKTHALYKRISGTQKAYREELRDPTPSNSDGSQPSRLSVHDCINTVLKVYKIKM